MTALSKDEVVNLPPLPVRRKARPHLTPNQQAAIGAMEMAEPPGIDVPWTDDDMRDYAILARAPLVAENAALKAEAEAGIFVHHREMDTLRSERDALKAEMERMKAGEPVAWEWRVMDTHPQTVTSGQWSEWERVVPRNPHMSTVQDRLAEFREYIKQGYKYELRALYTNPTIVQAGEPIGYLYSWIHSSATGRPDETYTSFATDINIAKRSEHHFDIRPVYAAQPSAVPVVQTLVEALKWTTEGNSGSVPPEELIAAALVAGQQYLETGGKESGG